jgi:transposase InsO family protein
MQVRGLPRQVIRSAAVASRIAAQSADSEAAMRAGLVLRWRRAMADGLTAEQAAQAVAASRASLYRWEKRPVLRSRRPIRRRGRTWSSDLVEAVERLRLDYPMWGKAKLGPLLRGQGFAVSDATIGRILNSLVNRGVVTPAPTLRRRPRRHRWSAKRHYAVRLPRDLKAAKPGGLVQVDTVFVNIAPDKAIKHFTAYCPVAKWTVGKAFNRATAASAASFLDKLVADMPFKVEAIQVDGGSEFKAEFETACQEKGIRLYELPPKRPQMNGAVERCNGAWRYEFYGVYDLPRSVEALNPILDSFQHLYNHHRPHGALAGITPVAYLAKRRAAETPPSHMS